MLNILSNAKSQRLSIVVVIYNMQREAPRTLYSLSPEYQHNVSADDYEVIVVDNGSAKPLNKEFICSFGKNFRYILIKNPSPSPAAAINIGVKKSKAPLVSIMIDGARLVSPGAVSLIIKAFEKLGNVIVGTVGFHLGPDLQTRSIQSGYNCMVEDELLDRIDWKNNGYRLFDVSTFAMSSENAGIGSIAESNLISLPRSLYSQLKGFDERFDLPGGGIVNHDFYLRASKLKNTELVTLLGEATFHQIHGGIMTNSLENEFAKKSKQYAEQYVRIRNEPFKPSNKQPILFGLPNSDSAIGVINNCGAIYKQYKRVLH